MDTDLVRTFLEVHRVRHFARAAERLFVTPAAVSARVRLLEAQLGVQLFNRSRNNIRLTAAGQRFLPHAEHLLRSLDRAMLSVGTAREDVQLVALGCLQSIWSVLLRGWLAEIQSAQSGALLQLELLTSQDVVARVREQSLDVGLVYEPPRVSDLAVEDIAIGLQGEQVGGLGGVLEDVAGGGVDGHGTTPSGGVGGFLARVKLEGVEARFGGGVGLVHGSPWAARVRVGW